MEPWLTHRMVAGIVLVAGSRLVGCSAGVTGSLVVMFGSLSGCGKGDKFVGYDPWLVLGLWGVWCLVWLLGGLLA